jgi:hypothetical protein
VAETEELVSCDRALPFDQGLAVSKVKSLQQLQLVEAPTIKLAEVTSRRYRLADVKPEVHRKTPY